MGRRDGKDLAQLQLAVQFLFAINQRKGPNGSTYIENIGDFILNEAEPISRFQPICIMDSS